MLTRKLSEYLGRGYAPVLARLGVGVVFFIFGVMQLTSPENWVGWLPKYIFNSELPLLTLIFFNGLLDIIIGSFLLIGLFLRFFSFIGIVHLFIIIISIGFNDVAVRDLGLLIVLVSVFLHGPDKLCIDKIK